MGVKACDVTGMHMSYHRLPWNFSHVTCHHGMVAQAKREQNKRCRQGVFHTILYIYIVITYYNIIGMLVRAPVGTGIIWHLVVHIHVGIFV